MSQPVYLVELLKKIYPSRFFLAKLTRIPIVGHLVDWIFFKGDSTYFLPHEDVARKLLIEQEIEAPLEIALPSQVVTYFIEQAQHHWLMDSCICRDAEGCQEYPIDLGCLFLGEATLEINPKLGHHVSKQEALEHVKRCQEAGLIPFVGRNKLDSVWLGVRPGEKLLTICHCCPCCCLWGILPELAPQIEKKIERMPGVMVTVNGQCTGCGMCAEDICFVRAIRLEDDRATINEMCKGCGRCVAICPEEAIELTIDWEMAVGDSVERLSSLVDVK